MKYVVYDRFEGQAMCGNVNLPPMTVCEETNGFIHDDKRVFCYYKSENAHNHFARNDDGKGMERGNLILRILDRLRSCKAMWDRVWEDELCQKYKRPEDPTYWLWNHDFYNAEIADLRYIAKLVGA